ncbi:MAG TPA: hypothetical protein PKD75_07070 [Tepidiformaceae bacterium]|nr:hypothetical protein [Tepidiformaceae bacterium]
MRRPLLFTIAAWLLGAVLLRGTFLAPQYCPAIDADGARASARAAASWIERNQLPDGTYVYEYRKDDNANLGGYNVVRHAGVTMSLYQLAAAGDMQILAAADRGLAWMNRNLYRNNGWVALQDPADGGIRLGASALMLAGVMQRRLATGDYRYDELARSLARGLLALQLPDGAFLNRWNPAANAPVPGERSKYATGEAFWALTLMHRVFPGEGWDQPAWLTADYLALHRDEVEQQKYPPWADQWAAYGLGEMATWPLEDHHIAYARSLAERFGLLVRVESQRRDNRLSKLIHGRQARAAGMGTWVEGLTSLHRLAVIDPRMSDLEPKIAERIACGAGMLAGRQYSSADAAVYAEPPRVEGAWFTEGVTRMDDQQHALSGLLYAAPIIEGVKPE